MKFKNKIPGEGNTVDVIRYLETKALSTIQCQKNDPIVRQLATLDLIVKPSIQERIFSLKIRMSYIFGQGCCYLRREDIIDQNEDTVLGLDFRKIMENKISIFTKISLIDSVLAADETRTYSTKATLAGDISSRARERGNFIVTEINKIPPQNHSNTTILIIGASKEIAQSFLNNGYNVYITDLDPQVVGTSMHDRQILNGTNNLQLIEVADHVIATGMTIANGTFDAISEKCISLNKRLWLYSETAAYASRLLVPTYVDGVFSEPFPFYVFGAQSEIFFFKK